MSAGGEIVSIGARKYRSAAPKRQSKLTEEHRFTIRFALRAHFNLSMTELDFHNNHTGHWLRTAGEAWDAYSAFVGQPIHDKAGP